jgi:hypothetical protein
VLIIISSKRKKKNKVYLKNLKDIGPIIDKGKVEFTLEDVPFHEMRLYLDGENNYNKPWAITEAC